MRERLGLLEPVTEDGLDHGLDFLPPITAYSSEMLVPSRKLTASHRCGIEEAANLEAMTSSTISFRT